MAKHLTLPGRLGEMPLLTVRNGVPGYQFGDRFIPRMAGGEDDPKPGEGDPQKGDDPKDAGDDFDKDRALATIRKLRENEKATKAQLKELDDLRSKVKAAEDKDKTESERLAGSAKEAGEKLTASEARARDLAIRLAVAETASTIGITGASVKAAVRLLDHGALEFDDDGSPTNVEAALKALVKEYPMLAAEDGAGKKAEKGTPPMPKPATNGTSASEREQKDLEGLRATGRYSV